METNREIGYFKPQDIHVRISVHHFDNFHKPEDCREEDNMDWCKPQEDDYDEDCGY